MGTGSQRGAIGVAGMILVAAVFAASASAGPPAGFACVYDSAAKQLTVTNQFGGAIFFSVDSGDIVLDGGGPPLPCTGGAPTVNNVDLISFTDTGTDQGSQIGISAPALFAPGATDAGDGFLNPNEIEWDVDLGDGVDAFSYFASGDPGGARVTLGTAGINHNVSDSELANDVDVEVAGVNRYRFEGANDNDGVSGAGTQGTGDPIKRPFDFFGNVGMYGAGGDDYLVGGRGDDLISGSWGADYINGGKGKDTADWDDSPVGVVVDIDGQSADDGGMNDNSVEPPSTARDTVAGNVENLLGGDFDDILRGDGGANVLIGGLGQDRLFGLAGSDRLKAKDGIADLKLRCGAGADRPARIDLGLDPNPKSC